MHGKYHQAHTASGGGGEGGGGREGRVHARHARYEQHAQHFHSVLIRCLPAARPACGRTPLRSAVIQRSRKGLQGARTPLADGAPQFYCLTSAGQPGRSGGCALRLRKCCILSCSGSWRRRPAPLNGGCASDDPASPPPRVTICRRPSLPQALQHGRVRTSACPNGAPPGRGMPPQAMEAQVQPLGQKSCSKRLLSGGRRRWPRCSRAAPPPAGQSAQRPACSRPSSCSSWRSRGSCWRRALRRSLWWATCQRGDHAALRSAGVSTGGASSFNPLVIAVRQQCIPVARLLLQHGANAGVGALLVHFAEAVTPAAPARGAAASPGLFPLGGPDVDPFFARAGFDPAAVSSGGATGAPLQLGAAQQPASCGTAGVASGAATGGGGPAGSGAAGGAVAGGASVRDLDAQ